MRKVASMHTDEMPAAGRERYLSAGFADEIEKLIPGGVNSPFRSFEEVGGQTIFFARAEGSRLFDVDGNSYIDYLGAWGPAVLGHCPPPVVAACQDALAGGPVLGAPHTLEIEMARLMTGIIPGIEKVRFVNSGTEAVMSAVRLARGITGRDLIVIFEGSYHGHFDTVLASRGHSASAGIPEAVARQTLLVPYNDLESLRICLSDHGGDVAAVLIEPVAGSMGVVPPEPGFLPGVAELTARAGALLVFDEVLTGFRVHLKGAQGLYGVTADIVCFGKALAGGMPVGAYGGRTEIMDNLAPTGSVYQAGTFSGNPVTMAGGVETLRLLSDPAVYDLLEARSRQLEDAVVTLARLHQLPLRLQRVGSMFSILFCEQPVRSWSDSLKIDRRAYARFFHALLDAGIYLPPSSVDAACLSAAHSEKDIEETVSMVEKVLCDCFSRG